MAPFAAARGSANFRPTEEASTDRAMDPEDAAEYIVQQVFGGAFAPGARLTERDVADVCGGTHAFARNVIHRLQMLGAVRFSSRRGATILGPSDFRIEEVERVWQVLLNLLQAKADRAFKGPARGGDRYAQLLATRSELERLGQRAQDPRLSELLQRVALQRLLLQGAA